MRNGTPISKFDQIENRRNAAVFAAASSPAQNLTDQANAINLLALACLIKRNISRLLILWLLCPAAMVALPENSKVEWAFASDDAINLSYKNQTLEDLIEVFRRIERARADRADGTAAVDIRLDMDYPWKIVRHDSGSGPYAEQIEDLVSKYSAELHRMWADFPVPHQKLKPLEHQFSGQIRDVPALRALEAIVEIAGYHLIRTENTLIVSPQREGPHVNVFAVPQGMQDLVDEILEDGHDPELTAMFSRQTKYREGYVGVLGPEHLIVIGMPDFYGTVAQGIEILANVEYSSGMRDYGYIRLISAPWVHIKNWDNFFHRIGVIDWEAMWREHSREIAEHVPSTNNGTSDPFSGMIPVDRGPKAAKISATFNLDHLTLTQAGADQFIVTYTWKTREGKYFSESESLATDPVELTREQIRNLFRLHVEGRRDELRQTLNDLTGNSNGAVPQDSGSR